MKRLLFFLLALLPLGVLAQAGSGTALDFNGSSSYATADTLNLSNNQVSMMTWIKVDAFKTGFPFISSVMGTEQPGNSAFIRLGDASLAASRLQFVLTISSTQVKLDGITNLQTNRWYHIAATYDGSQMRLYIDGMLDASMAMSGTITSNDLFEIGRNFENTRILDGSMDEMSVWTTAVSQSTIREWMCKRTNSSHPDFANLLAYWRFDEGSGTSSADLSANTNNATLVSSPNWVNSGAAIGDESIQSYSGALGMSIAHPDGDSIEVVATGGTIDGLHLYRVDSMPNTLNTGTGLTSVDSTRYWGVFKVGSGNYTLRYNYDANSALAGQSDCFFQMGRRNNGASSSWATANGQNQDLSADTIQVFRNASQEFIAGFNTGLVIHTINFTSSNVLCNGDSNGSATANVSGGVQPYVYLWSNGGNTATLNNLAAGTYTLSITDSSNCNTIESVTITQPSPLVATGVTVTENDCQIDEDGAVQATVTGGTTPYQYIWNDPMTQAAVSATNLANGTYTVTVTDDNGCTDTSMASVTNLFPDPVPTLGSDTSVCSGDSVSLLPTGSAGPYVVFAWSDGNNLSFNNAQPGTYTVTVTNGNGCTGVSAPVTISALPLPTPNLGPDISQQNPPATLDAGPGFSIYDWSTGDNTQTISVSIAGTYFVVVTDNNGCTGTDTIEVEFAPINVPELVNDLDVKVYPNPARDQVYIELPEEVKGKVKLEVLDLRGRQVATYSLTPRRNALTLDLSGYATGMYLLRFTSDSGYHNHPLQVQE
ncbi:MAG: LamG-like jellyroll fold domain-containing protein [Salibacteraceae bacterium]